VSFWESEHTRDIIQGYLESWERLDLHKLTLHHGPERFRADNWTAARGFWGEVRSGISEALAAGPESLPDKHLEHFGELKNPSPAQVMGLIKWTQ
jgi:hypothetical protein